MSTIFLMKINHKSQYIKQNLCFWNHVFNTDISKNIFFKMYGFSATNIFYFIFELTHHAQKTMQYGKVFKIDVFEFRSLKMYPVFCSLIQARTFLEVILD